jgi:hypothetical protein
MFTWEEAGQLRGMLQVLKWCVIALVVGLLAIEHEPLGAALHAGVRLIGGRTPAPSPPAPPDTGDER